jgi:LPS-assembly protein
MAAASPPPDKTGIKVARNLDWVDERALTEDQRNTLAPGCCGAYIEPERDYPEAELDPKEASLRATATTTEAQNNVATMTGDVQISQGYRQVRSDVAIVNQNDRSVELKGGVQFREPGLLMLGDRAFVNLDTQQVEIENATYVIHESVTRGTAGNFKRDIDDYVYIDNATYTTCEPGNNSWRLVAPHISINPDTGMATARHVRVEIKDVPVFYSPWLRFPADGRRATGLLFPEISVSEDNGFEYAQPIYLNLAPNYDATVTPRYIQERGEMMELEFRHLAMFSELMIGGAYLADDDGGDDDDEEHPAKKSFAGEDRWLVNVDHNGGMGQAWSTYVDYTKVSDEDYFRDLGNVTLQASSATHLRQLAEADYRFDNWWFGIKAAKYQTLIHRTLSNKLERQYQQLPRVDAIGNYKFYPWGLDLELNLQHQYTEFDHRDNLDLAGATIITGNRLRTDYALSLNKQWAMGYIRPSLKLKYLSYDLDASVIAGGDDSPSVTVPVAIIDAGLFFERDTTWLTNHIQTFEPRLYYLNSDYQNQIDHPVFDSSELTFSYQQLFRDDRFSGGDRIGDAEQVTVGFTSRLIDATTGIERLRGSLGQIFYFKDRYVSLDSTLTRDFLRSPYDPALLTPEARDIAADLHNDDSNIAGELAGYIARHWRFQSDILYDENDDKVDKGSFSFRYNDRQNNIFNASYRYTRKAQRIIDMGLPSEKSFDADIEQADISAIFALNPSWSLIGRWNHDVTNSRELEVFGGIEYNSCCWRSSIILRHWLDRDDDLLIPEENLEYDDGIFFQIQLKGLAGTGSGVEGILSDGIYGYESD